MSKKSITRRDAMKILGAAVGGAALATIPPKWSKPALAVSQLPVHARQSVVVTINFVSNLFDAAAKCNADTLINIVQVTPSADVVLQYTVTLVNISLVTIDGAPVSGAGPFSGQKTTGAGGPSLTIVFDPTSITGLTQEITVAWQAGSNSISSTYDTFGC